MNKTNVLLLTILLSGCATGRNDMAIDMTIGESQSPVPVTDLRANEDLIVVNNALPTDTTYTFKSEMSVADYVSSRLVARGSDQEVQIHSISMISNGQVDNCFFTSLLTNAKQPYVKNQITKDSDVTWLSDMAPKYVLPCLDRHIEEIQNAL